MRIKKLIITAMFICFIICVVNSKTTYAKQKTTVHYELRNGTLTIKGKGNMPDSMVFSGNKKIKKVVVKKGVTSITGRAFYNCTNVKSISLPSGLKKIGRFAFQKTKISKLTIPKTITYVGVGAFYDCKKLKSVTMPGSITTKVVDADMESPTFLPEVKTVKYSTNLSIKKTVYVRTENFVVSKKDKKYSSKDGVIYSKDGKKAVRLPAREEVELAEGCETFTIESFLYHLYLGDDYYLAPGKAIKKIILPKSVTKIYTATGYNVEVLAEGLLEKIIVKNKDISESEIQSFMSLIPSNYITSETDDNVIEIDREHIYDNF